MLEQFPLPDPTLAIHLQLSDRPLATLVGELLQEWGFPLCEHPAPGALQLAELPPEPGVLQLQTGRRQPLASLPRPLDPAQLYQVLARQFAPERSEQPFHLRLEQTLTIQVGGQSLTGRSRSLSERGLRFSLPQELACGERLELLLDLGRRQYRLGAEVVYVLPGKELGWGERVDIGVRFKPLAAATRHYLRDWLLGRLLRRLAKRLPQEDFQAARAQLQLPVRSLAMLEGVEGGN